MANDLDLYGPGDLAPYSPGGLQPLAPAPDWQHGGDLLPTDYHAPGEGQLLFGQYPLPPGVTLDQAVEAYNRLGGVFCADMMKCGMNVTQSQDTVQWYLNAAKNPPARKHYQHPFNLHEHRGDILFEAYAAWAYGRGYTQRFITACCWWVTEAGKRLALQDTSSQHGTPPRVAPSSDPTDSLSDSEFEAVVRANDAAKAKTQAYLENLWGQSYQQNIKMVDAYFQSLPIHEQRHLDVYTTGWIKALNTKEVILGLYKQAIGSASLPSGGGIQAEIEQCEHVMRTNRKAWNNDARLQSRYRHLLMLRDGG